MNASEPNTKDDAVQQLRERIAARVVKGAEALGLAVDQLSNRQQRLLAAVSDLPKPFETTRERGEGDSLSRDLTALRQRLDWLVRVEEEHGEEQKGKHHNRAERNALIHILQQQSERAGFEAAKPVKAQHGYQPEYIEEVEDLAKHAIEDGYTVTEKGQPGVLFHQREGQAPIPVPMNVWFAVRGYARAKGST